MILAIDPGTTQSGWCRFVSGRVVDSGVMQNDDILPLLRRGWGEALAIEMIASYGMAVGKEVFETCVWIGRFIEAARDMPHSLVYRREVKLHLCGSPKAKDTNIRQALIDKLGPVGTKAAQGPLYGVKSHAWAAVAVAVTAIENGHAQQVKSGEALQMVEAVIDRPKPYQWEYS